MVAGRGPWQSELSTLSCADCDLSVSARAVVAISPGVSRQIPRQDHDVGQDRPPKQGLEPGFANLVAEAVLRHQGSRPPAEQAHYVEGLLRDPPAVNRRLGLVGRVAGER